MKNIEELYAEEVKYPVQLTSKQAINLVIYAGVEYGRVKAMYDSNRGGINLKLQFLNEMLYFSKLELTLVESVVRYDNVKADEGDFNIDQIKNQIATIENAIKTYEDLLANTKDTDEEEQED